MKDLSPEQRLQERQNSIKPLVEKYFAWVKKQLSDTTVLPKGKTADGLKYSVNQEQYLKGLKQLLQENNYNPVTIRFYEREWNKIQCFLTAEYGNTEYDMERGLKYLEETSHNYMSSVIR